MSRPSTRSLPSGSATPIKRSRSAGDRSARLALACRKEPDPDHWVRGPRRGASAAIESLSVAAGIRVIDFLTFTNIGRSFAHFGGFQSDDLADVDVGLLVDVDVP